MSVHPVWEQQRGLSALLWAYSYQVAGTLFHPVCLLLQKIAAACMYHCMQSHVSHTWYYVMHGGAMLPASNCNLSGDASKTGSSYNMCGSWLAGLFQTGDSWQTPEVPLVVCDSVAVLIICTLQCVGR